MAVCNVVWYEVCQVGLCERAGNTPAGRRERSLSTYLETGSVLIESATDTERVAGALATLAPLVPGLRYFRCVLPRCFTQATVNVPYMLILREALWPQGSVDNWQHCCRQRLAVAGSPYLPVKAPMMTNGLCRFCPEDPRCGMELDEINPDKWAALEAATNEYIIAEDVTFDAAAAALCSRLASGTTFTASQERLGEGPQEVVRGSGQKEELSISVLRRHAHCATYAVLTFHYQASICDGGQLRRWQANAVHRRSTCLAHRTSSPINNHETV